jgi:hypothetical protein
MKIFFWTMLAVVAGIFVYSRVTAKTMPFSRKNPAPGTTYKDGTGATEFAGPDVDVRTGAYLPPDAKVGTVEFPAQGN